MSVNVGKTEAIRDWFNASFYNKEEIANLFIEKNQSGLKAYDLTIEGDTPDQFIKLVGQTSGQVYNVCLAYLLGENMKETVLWENSEMTNPSTITLNDDWTNYKFLMIVAKTWNSTVNHMGLSTAFIPVSRLKKIVVDNSQAGCLACSEMSANQGVAYQVTSENTLVYFIGSGYYIDSILGYK